MAPFFTGVNIRAHAPIPPSHLSSAHRLVRGVFAGCYQPRLLAGSSRRYCLRVFPRMPKFGGRAIIAVCIFAFYSPTARFSSSMEELSRGQSWMELESDAVAQFPTRYTSDCPPEWNHNRWSITGRTVSESFTDTLAPATLPP